MRLMSTGPGENSGQDQVRGEQEDAPCQGDMTTDIMVSVVWEVVDNLVTASSMEGSIRTIWRQLDLDPALKAGIKKMIKEIEWKSRELQRRNGWKDRPKGGCKIFILD